VAQKTEYKGLKLRSTVGPKPAKVNLGNYAEFQSPSATHTEPNDEESATRNDFECNAASTRAGKGRCKPAGL
jgi:hypothetical protein